MANQSLYRVISKSLGELLVERGLLTRERCDEALEYGRVHGLRLGEALLALGFAGNEMISCALGHQFGLTPIELTPDMVDETLVRRFPREALEEHLALPLVEIGREIMVVISDPHNNAVLETLGKYVPGFELTAQLGDPAQISRCLDAAYSGSSRITKSRAPEGKELLDFFVHVAASEHGSDIVLLSRGGGAVLFGFGGDLDEKRSARLLHEFDSMRVSTVSAAFAAHGRPLNPAVVPVSIWPETVESQSGHFVIFAASMGDLSGEILRFRALKVISSNGVSNKRVAQRGSVVLLMYYDVTTLREFVENLAHQTSASRPLLIFQDTMRFLFPGAVLYPAAYVNPGVVIAACSPETVLFDSPASVATIQSAHNASTVYVAVALGQSGEGKRAAQIINELNPLVLDLRNGSANVAELSPGNALKILGEG